MSNQFTNPVVRRFVRRFARQIAYSLAVLILIIPVIIQGSLHKAQATALTVTNLNDSGAGSLRQTITSAAAGDTISFNAGLSGTLTLTSGELTITKTLTINGPGVALLTLSGNGTQRIFTVNYGVTLTLSHLTLANASVSGNGGAINGINTAVINVYDSAFTNNVVTPAATFDNGGGGIFSQGGFVNVVRTAFTNNTSNSSSGGAIHVLRSNLTITDCTFTTNKATGIGVGGAVYVDGGLPNNGAIIITGSTFTGNTTLGEGGAVKVYMYQGSDYMTVDRSTFVNNTVSASASGLSLAGALKFGNGKITVTNSLFTGNTANKGDGGAIAITEDARITIANSTITGSTATIAQSNGGTGNGGGIFIANNTTPFAIINTTLAKNTAGWGGGAIASGTNGVLTNTVLAYNIALDGGNTWGILYNCTALLTDGGNNIQYPPKTTNPFITNDTNCTNSVALVDPKLDNLTQSGSTAVMPLLPGSPALNAGNSSVCLTAPISNVDQRGAPRVSGSNPVCDIGAYEAPYSLPKDTIGIYRRSNNQFYLRNSNTTGTADTAFVFGSGTSIYPVTGDWNNSGIDTIGAYNQTTGLFQLRDSNNAGTPDHQLVLGNPNDQPFAGRWTQSMTHDGAGVFRPSNGLIYLRAQLTSGFADYTMVLGIPGDIGIAGDWNGDGVDSPGVYRPSNQTFFLSNKVQNGGVFGDYTVTLGLSGDVPVVGDWIAQGHAGVGVFRPSNGLIYLKNQLTSGFADATLVFGIPGDIPVAGHWITGSVPSQTPANSVLVPSIIIPSSATADHAAPLKPTVPSGIGSCSMDGGTGC